jgi:hypothetical protein
MCADFNERSFEFAFNAEYIRRCAPFLLKMPQIPSQRQERALVYDVALVVKAGMARRSILFQHKVSSFAQNRWTNNTDVYDLYVVHITGSTSTRRIVESAPQSEAAIGHR